MTRKSQSHKLQTNPRHNEEDHRQLQPHGIKHTIKVKQIVLPFPAQ